MPHILDVISSSSCTELSSVRLFCSLPNVFLLLLIGIRHQLHRSSSLQILCPIKSSFSKFFWSHFLLFFFFSSLVYLYDWCVLLLTWYLIITMLLVTNPYMSSPCQGWFYKPGTNAFDNLALPVFHWLFQTSAVIFLLS